MKILEWCYTENFESFDEWYCLLKSNEEVYPKYRIPYNEWLEEYIENIEVRDEDEVKELLRYLLAPFTRGIDMSDYETYIKLLSLSKECEEEYVSRRYIESYMKIEKNIRVMNGQDCWEGLTWILQLLPYHPYEAIKALGSYLSAEIEYMPDDRIIGINQCISIIEAKFIYSNNGLENYILNLTPREFELLIASLYEQLGYEIQVTPATRDGGKDIVAKIKREDGNEVVYVECKLYKTTELTKDKVGYFAYNVINDKVNRGIIFCTGYVNEKIKKMDCRIQIWTLEEMIILLNSHLGSDWFERINSIIKNQRYKYK